MIVNTVWVGNGTEQSPFKPKETAQMKGKSYGLVPNQAAPKAGASVKVEVF